MRVYLGSDHAGFDLKAALLTRLPELGHEPMDCGAVAYDPDDDYPGPCIEAARRVVADPGSLGVVIGGSGNGEQIAANKVLGVRCALAWSEETAALSRQHNNANLVGIGARQHTLEQAVRLVEVFLATPFSEDPRHQRRIDMVGSYEADGTVPSRSAIAGVASRPGAG